MHRSLPTPVTALLLAAVVAAAAITIVVRQETVTRHGAGSLAPGARAAATFIAQHVSPDGRVTRRDQGGDIVSEGEAYAMILAEVAGEPAVVRAVWAWTHTHMQRSDGLLSYHTDGNGRVLDQQPAADADTLAAYALLRYAGRDAPALHQAGRRLASAVLAHETITRGRTVWTLVAGPWALSPPATVDPSYLMPPVFRALAQATRDPRWEQLADNSVRLLNGLLHAGARLPPDWARVQGAGLVAAPAPGGGQPVQYGPDAARLPVWLAMDTSPVARALAAHLRSLVQGPVHVAALSLALDGRVLDASRAPLSLVASAAMARAAGDDAAAARLAAAAVAQARQAPSYYGDAWAALGQALISGAWTVD